MLPRRSSEAETAPATATRNSSNNQQQPHHCNNPDTQTTATNTNTEKLVRGGWRAPLGGGSAGHGQPGSRGYTYAAPYAHPITYRHTYKPGTYAYAYGCSQVRIASHTGTHTEMHPSTAGYSPRAPSGLALVPGPQTVAAYTGRRRTLAAGGRDRAEGWPLRAGGAVADTHIWRARWLYGVSYTRALVRRTRAPAHRVRAGVSRAPPQDDPPNRGDTPAAPARSGRDPLIGQLGSDSRIGHTLRPHIVDQVGHVIGQ